MKIILIGIPHQNLYSKISKSFGKTPPINLACLASFLLKKGFEVNIIDPVADEITLEKLPRYFPKEFDVVGISSLTPTIIQSVEILKIAKKLNPNCFTIMGGPHISALPYKTMSDFLSIDYGIVGEGEITLFKLLVALKQKEGIVNIKGLVFRNNGSIKFTGYPDRITNLDTLPFPAYQLLQMDKYSIRPHHFWSKGNIELKPYTNLFTSRGCFYHCTFCGVSQLWGNKIYFKSTNYVLNEIGFLVKKFKIKAIEISDSCFLADKQRAHQILDGLKNKNYNANFTCMARVDHADEYILEKLKMAKFRLIRFGVESGAQQILDAMEKGFKVEQIKKTFLLTHKVNIAATACVIIGYPGETKATFKKTLRLLKEIRPTAVDFYIALPIIGTKLYEMALARGYICHQDWTDWTFLPKKPALNTPYLSSRDLKLLKKKAYLAFYFNPRFIIKSLLDLRSFKKIKYYALGLKTLISQVLKG